MSNQNMTVRILRIDFNSYNEYLNKMIRYNQPKEKILDTNSFLRTYGNHTGFGFVEVPKGDRKTPQCKMWDCKRPISKIPSGAYFALCDIHKLNKRNNGSELRGTLQSHLSGPFRYVAHRLIAKVVEQVGDFKGTNETPSVSEVARSDKFEMADSTPIDQPHLDPQVIGRIVIGLRTLDNKGGHSDQFMDFYYMNKFYAKHKYCKDSNPTKLMRYVWNHLLRFQEVDRVKLLSILIGLNVLHDNDVDGLRTRERPEYIQIQTAKMLLRQLKPFTKVWENYSMGPNNFKVKPKLNKKLMIKLGKEALELADWILMGPGGRKINEYILRKATERRKKLFVTMGDFGVEIYRPAVKLSR